MKNDKTKTKGLTKGKEKAKEAKVKKDVQMLRCEFTTEEINEKAKQLANENRNYTEIENDKKSVTADFGARLAESKAKIDRLANHINSGYELRRVNVEVRMHDPEEGKKTVVRLDTNETVEILNMTEDELQEELDFENAGKIKSPEMEVVENE